MTFLFSGQRGCAGFMRLLWMLRISTGSSAAEFDTQLPHWFGPAADEPVEILSIHSSRGKPLRIRAAPKNKNVTG